ncbi:MAG: ferritin family protein [Chloroflexi bacterium]|nr:ferritin family protein [Chloroflexota bacterium]
MGILLSGADIIDLAIQTEEKGEAFYREAAKKTGAKDACELFTYLADQEQRHKQVFAQLGNAIVVSDLEPAEWQEALDYINATVSQTFFSDGTPIRAIESGSSVREMIERAIAFEQQTLLFFYTLRELVQPANRRLVDSIVAEERTHVRRLAAMRSA